MDTREQGRVGFGRAYGGPGKYIQRANEIERLPDHVKPLGDKAFLLVDGFVLDSMGDALRASFERAASLTRSSASAASAPRRRSLASRLSCASSRRGL